MSHHFGDLLGPTTLLM